MTTSEIQWRVCAQDHGDLTPDYGSWTNDEEMARTMRDETLTFADPGYDDAWVERRTVVYGEPERVE